MSEDTGEAAQQAHHAQAGHTSAGRSVRAVTVFVLVTLVVLGADLALKQLSFRYVAGEPVRNVAEAAEDEDFWRDRYPHAPVTVIPGLLNLHLTTNTGAVFGLGKGGQWLFIIVSIAACMLIVRIFWKSAADGWLLHLSLALIMAGALGNLYDRIRFAAVRDMLHLFPGSGLWPWIFNLADAALLTGVVLVIGLTWWRELRERGDGSARG